MKNAVEKDEKKSEHEEIMSLLVRLCVYIRFFALIEKCFRQKLFFFAFYNLSFFVF